MGDSSESLSSLANLDKLSKLNLDIYGLLPSGGQLPASLSSLSRLTDLNLTAYHSVPGSPGHQRLPWAWCHTATRLLSAYLVGLDLPRLRGAADDGPAYPALTWLQLSCPRDPISNTALERCQAVRVLGIDYAVLRQADWAALASLPHLRTLAIEDCSYEEGGDGVPLPQLLGALTSLTCLLLDGHPLLPAITQLPALRSLHVNNYDMRGEGVGWPLPPGPWLQRLEDLTLEGDMGSMETALRQATQLTCLWLDGCPWLRFGRDELPLLLALPLREFSIDKRIEWDEEMKYAPRPLWDGDSLWVVEGLRYVLGVRAARGEPVSCNICTKACF